MAKRKTRRRRKSSTMNKKYILLLAGLIIFLVNFFGEKFGEIQNKSLPEKTYKVLYVSDGDTLTVDDGGSKRKLRLYGIDAPEKTQTYGLESKEFLLNKIRDKNIEVTFISKDRYGRDISVIYLENENINELMVREGYAWWYKEYAKDDFIYGEYEKKAREKKKGLWSKSNPVPPWEYRKNKKTKK